MRRNSSYQAILAYSFAFLLFCFYSFLGDFLVWLPPLLGVMFVWLCDSMQNNRLQDTMFILLCVSFWEMDKGLAFGLSFTLLCVGYFVFYRLGSFLIYEGLWLKVLLIVGFYVLFFGVLFLDGYFEDLKSVLILFALCVILESIWVGLNATKV